MRQKESSLRIAAVALTLALSSLPDARGAGFALYEMSARGNALGGSLVGITGDASATYFNPANMTESAGVQVMAGASFIGPRTEVSATVPSPLGMSAIDTKNESQWWIPPHAYASMAVSEKTWVGIGIYSPFGLGSVFESDWIGRYNSYKAIIESVDMNPNAAYKLNDKLSVAVGLQIVSFDLLLKRKIPNMLVAGGPDFDFELDGDGVGYGGNAAISFRANEKLGFGLVYRSEVSETVRGDAVLTAMGTKMGTDAEGTVVLPASTVAGANYQKGDLTLGAAVTFTEWSSYDELKVEFANPAVLGRSESVTEKDWNNVWRYAVGAEYAMNDTVTLRCSYTFDEDPVPDSSADYLVPSNDRHLFGVGAGFKVGASTMLDLGYTYLLIEDRNDVQARPLEGVFASDFKNGDTHIIGISLAGAF